MTDNFDVVVDFSTNEEGNRRIINDASDIEKELKKLEEQAKRTGKTLEEVGSENLDLLRKMTEETRNLRDETREQAAAAAESARQQARLFSTEARYLSNRARAVREQVDDLRRYQNQIAGISRLLLVGGAAITGGIFKLASDFVKNAPEATKLTLQWKEAQDSLAASSQKIGKASAEAALPILRTVARLAERTANFIETHPELVRAALNVGLITAGIGILGTLVSKGIKLYADVLLLQALPLQNEAARLQLLASEQMMVAAKLQAQAAGADVIDDFSPLTSSKGGGGLKGLGGKAGPFLAVLGRATVLLGAFTAGLAVGDKLFDNLLKHDAKLQDYTTWFKQALTVRAKDLGDLLAGKQFSLTSPFGVKDTIKFSDTQGTDWFKKVGQALGLLKKDADDAADSLEELAGSVRSSEAFEQVLAAYEDYRNDDLALVQEHYAARKDIVADGLQAELDANRKYASSVSKIQIDTSRALTDLANDYHADVIKAEQDYNKQRADILRDAGEDIQRIEEDLRESLRKNELEHEQRRSEIIASRNALALVQEDRRFEQQQAEERRQANIQIRRLRQDLARRLAELDAEFAAERAMRYQEYIQRAAEIRQQAADRLRELQLQHQEEIRQIREQTAAKLREEDAAFMAERRRRYEYFIAQIRDLDAALLGERQLRINYQNAMIADLDAFLAAYKAGLASIATAVPGKATGNYTSGLVMTGEKGYEWIATHDSTVAAEKIIGGRLTQEMFVNAMKALRAVNQATYIDQRRMEVPMNKETKGAYKQGAMDALRELLGV